MTPQAQSVIAASGEVFPMKPVFQARPVAAVAQPVTDLPKLSKKDLNKLLNDFARACAFGEDSIARMAAAKAIHEYLDAAFGALAASPSCEQSADAESIMELVDTLVASVNEAHLAKSDGWKQACFDAADSAIENIRRALAASSATPKEPA